MSEIETEEYKIHDLGKKRYLKWLKFFFLIVILYIIWIIIVISSIYFFNMGYRWSYFTIDQWIIGGCVLIGVFLIFELFFIFTLLKHPEPRGEKKQAHMYNGKQLHVFTYPVHVKGGIFSRTYIPLDENAIIRIRTQMIQPEQLWGKKIIKKY